MFEIPHRPAEVVPVFHTYVLSGEWLGEAVPILYIAVRDGRRVGATAGWAGMQNGGFAEQSSTMID